LSLNRWGDYSMMAVDPTDDCTFWYTQEYYAATSSASWQTRIGSFKFPGCGTLGYTQTPQGNWVGDYGADGYDLLGWDGSDLAWFPQSRFVLDHGGRFNSWNGSGGTSDLRALQGPDTTTRRATCIFDANQLRLHLTFTAAYTGDVHLYALDWDSTARRESITVDDGSGPRTANITTPFDQGAWVNASIVVPSGGTVTILVDHLAGANAVLSGIFLGGPGLGYRQAPQGNWVGNYGLDGYNLLAWNGSDLTWSPQFSFVLDQGGRFNGWTGISGTNDVRALQSPDGTRRSTCIFDPNQLRMRLSFAKPYTGTLHLYALDWDSTTRRESITVNDGSGPRTASITTAFDQGAWVNVSIAVPSGRTVSITVDHITGANAVLSGIFLGGPSMPYSQAPQGNWVGTYGANGYDLFAWSGTDLVLMPQSTVILDQGTRYNSWSGSNGTSQVRALQSPDTSSRRGTCIYDANQLRLHLTFSSSYSGALHIYALDWDSTSRREAVTIDDGSGPRTANITTAFDQGAWVNASINVQSGASVNITVANLSGANAVISGIFLD
jgi:hypothetical protein